jgi:hypothetical protein
MVSAEQFLDIFSAKWIEVDSEELQVGVGVGALRRRPARPASHAAQLFSFSLYDDDNKGYITKEDLDRCVCLRASWRAPHAAVRRVSAMLGKEESAVPFPCKTSRHKLPATNFPPQTSRHKLPATNFPPQTSRHKLPATHTKPHAAAECPGGDVRRGRRG